MSISASFLFTPSFMHSSIKSFLLIEEKQTISVLLKIVGKILYSFSVVKIAYVLSKGSSKNFNKAFASLGLRFSIKFII